MPDAGEHRSARFRPRLTYANVVSTFALFVALGGSAFAVTKLAKNSVKSKHIAPGAVKTADIAPNAVTGVQIKDGTVTASDIAKGTVSAAEIADGTLTAAELASGSVGSDEVANGTITAAEIADGSVSVAEIGAGAVTAAKLAPNAVGPAALAADAVGSGTVANDSLTGADIDESALGVVPSAASASDAAQFDGRASSAYGSPAVLGRLVDLGTGSSPNLMPSGVVTDTNTPSSTIVPTALVARDLRVALVGGPLAAGQTRTFTMVKAGAGTTLSCTIPAGGSACQNNADAIQYGVGNQIAISLSATGSPTGTQDVQYSYTLAPE